MKGEDILLPFLLRAHQQHRLDPTRRTLFVGMQGPQGIGKSTLVKSLQQKLNNSPGRPLVVTLSLDDFYSTHKDQLALAAKYRDNPLLQYRGNPGTHDIPLALDILNQVRKGQPANSIRFPLYDKSLHQGRGDRLPFDEWFSPDVNAPVDILIIEGWCLGYHPISLDSIQKCHIELPCSQYPLSALIQVNECLKHYQPLYDYMDAFIQLTCESMDLVYEWRWQQEVESNHNQLSKQQIDDFVDRFMPAYYMYNERLFQDGLHRLDSEMKCKVKLDRYRQVMDKQSG